MVSGKDDMLRLLALPLALAATACVEPNSYDRPGSYALAASVISADEAAIRITANDVTLDLGGHSLRCVHGKPAEAVSYGVHMPGVSGVTIRNGAISGCTIGILADSGSGHRIEAVDFTGNTHVGISLGGGHGHVVTGSRFAAIRGFSHQGYAIGINGVGSGSVISDNDFADLDPQPGTTPDSVGEGVGVIISAEAADTVVAGNRFSGRPEQQFIGIWTGAGTRGIRLESNVSDGVARPIAGYTGMAIGNRLRLPEPVPGSVGIHLNAGTATGNRIIGFDTPWGAGVTDRGGNFVSE